MKLSVSTKLKWLLVVLLGLAFASACAPEVPTVVAPQPPSVADKVQQQMNTRGETYVPTNNVEFNNYNERQKISDDATTILWCTYFPPTVGQEPFTVAYVGKLTSGTKRPYATTQAKLMGGYSGSSSSFGNSWDVTYNPELPGPDGMYGASAEYKYGFTPAGIYAESESMSTFCTTELTVWQKNTTSVVVKSDGDTGKIQQDAKAALKAGDKAKALQILEQVETNQIKDKVTK
jgi:hypothetical protein